MVTARAEPTGTGLHAHRARVLGRPPVCDHPPVETVAARADEPGPRVAEADDSGGPGESAQAFRWDRFDWFIVAIVGAATFFVHPIHLMLTRPYWLDEAWVADLTRVPWTRLPRLSSSTPVGFVALLRLVPGAGTQRGRLVVLLLSAGTVGLAYVFVRALAWPSRDRARVAATIAALVTMLAPFALARNDLKQYTCDGFCALIVLTVAARVDRRDGDRRDGDRRHGDRRAPVWWLAAASVAVFPFSSTSVFVSVAAFAGVFASALLRRERRRIIEVAAFGAAAGLALAIYFAAVVSPNTNAALSAYWDHYYLRGSPWHMLVVTWTRLGAIERWIGMPEAVFVVLVLAGIVTLARLHATAIAIAIPVLWIELAVVAKQRRYPYLDLRTSHFLLVTSMVVLAIGVFGILQLVYRANRVVAVGAAIALAWMFALNFLPYVGKLEILSEDVRAQAAYVAANMTPHDVILVNDSGSFAFSYYWPHGAITTISDASAQGFRAHVRGLDAMYLPSRTNAAVLEGLQTALARWRAAGPGSRLYIVRSHVEPVEKTAWQRAFAAVHITPRQINVGREPLLVIGPP